MGLLLEIANRATMVTQNRSGTTGGILKQILNEELEEEKRRYSLEENQDIENGQVYNGIAVK